MAERAEVVGALARLFLEQELDCDKRQQVISAMLAVLDDPAARVRKALAEALADSIHAPQMILHALCEDICDVAAPVLAQSPALSEGWLVDMCGAGEEGHRVAIARRKEIGVPLAAAIAEIGGVPCCLTLLANPGAKVARSSLARMVERHREDARLRSALLARDDLSPMLRHRLVGGLSEALGTMIAEKGWLNSERTAKLMNDLQERATLEVACETPPEAAAQIVSAIHSEKGLTEVTLLLRAGAHTIFLRSRHLRTERCALKRVKGLLEDRTGDRFRSVYRKTKLPADSAGALWAALDVLFEMAPIDTAREAG
ncbi:MAG: DUF2336 domain-containing protein [Tepidamorphaceae bacterium]